MPINATKRREPTRSETPAQRHDGRCCGQYHQFQLYSDRTPAVGGYREGGGEALFFWPPGRARGRPRPVHRPGPRWGLSGRRAPESCRTYNATGGASRRRPPDGRTFRSSLCRTYIPRTTSQELVNARPRPVMRTLSAAAANGSNRIALMCPRSPDINALTCLDDPY